MKNDITKLAERVLELTDERDLQVKCGDCRPGVPKPRDYVAERKAINDRVLIREAAPVLAREVLRLHGLVAEKKYWDRFNAAEQILAAVAIAIGELGRGATGKNEALEIINRAIEAELLYNAEGK